jgi:ABC-type nickel/cobalt efflux system permease component RcnA
VVVLLAAVSVGRVGFGLALVGAFSLGLALVLLLLGVMTVVASQRLSGFSRGQALFAKLPVFSAGLVMLAGVAMAFGALYQAGILRWRGP